ncbi:FHIPEP family type III secretion protein [Escherichia coli]
MVEASTVVATHLNHLISQHAAELFGRQEAQQLLDRVAQGDAKADGRSRSRRRHAHHTA